MSMKLKSSNRITKPKNSDNNSQISNNAFMIDDSNSESNFPNIRRRISKACNYCRQRKIKCNGNSPCLNFKNHHIDCIYSNTIRKKKKQTTKKLTLQDLEKRINKMDSKFEFLNEKLTAILSILNERNINTDSGDSNKREQKMKMEKYKDNDGILSSDDEVENEDEDEDENDENDEGYDELEDPQLLSPLSNVSNSESLSSLEFNQNHQQGSDNFIQTTNDTSNYNTDQNEIIPWGGISGVNYTLNSYQYDNTFTNPSTSTSTSTSTNNSISSGPPTAATTTTTSTSFDFNNVNALDKKLNYFYSEVPLIGVQLDNNYDGINDCF